MCFSLHNRRAVGKIVGDKTYDVTVGELKKCGKFETVLVSSSQGISMENHSKSKVCTFKFTQDPKNKRQYTLNVWSRGKQ